MRSTRNAQVAMVAFAAVPIHSRKVQVIRYSSQVARLGGKGPSVWAVHMEAQRQRAAGREIFMLTVGDPDQAPPAPVIAATQKALDARMTGYSPILGIVQVREAIAARVARRSGMPCSVDSVVVVPGTQAGLFCTLQCLAGPGDEVIVPEPMYSTYEAVANAAGARIVPVPLRAERGYHIDIGSVRDALTEKTRAIWITSPHNPTGAVMTRQELEEVAATCRARDLWLISDEVYEDLVYSGAHASAWSLPGMAERTVVISSLSKSHAIPGFRMGWVIGPPELARHLFNLILAMLYGSPPFIQLGALPALLDDLADVATLRDDYRRRASLVAGILRAAPHCQVVPPAGGMFVMLDVRGSSLSSEDFAMRLLNEKAVAVLPCDGFGPSGAGQLRVSLTMKDDALAVAAHRIVEFARELAG